MGLVLKRQVGYKKYMQGGIEESVSVALVVYSVLVALFKQKPELVEVCFMMLWAMWMTMASTVNKEEGMPDEDEKVSAEQSCFLIRSDKFEEVDEVVLIAEEDTISGGDS